MSLVFTQASDMEGVLEDLYEQWLMDRYHFRGEKLMDAFMDEFAWDEFVDEIKAVIG